MLVLDSCNPAPVTGEVARGQGKPAVGVAANSGAVETAVHQRGCLAWRVLNRLFTFVGVLERDGTLIDANQPPLEAAGITIEEVRGRKFWDCFWWSYSETVQQQLRDACRRAAEGEVVRYHVPVRMAGDTRMIIDFQLAPLRDEQGRITHLIPSAVDITDRERSELSLRDREQRLRFVTERSPDNIFIQDRELRYVWVARPAVPLTREAYLGKTDFDLTDDPEDARKLTEIKRQVIDEGQPRTVEVALNLRGEGRVFEATYEPWRDTAGRVIGLAGYVRDITERRHAEAALRRAHDELEQRVAERTAEVEQRAAQLRYLATELAAAENRERKRLAALLHDELQQYLVALKLQLAQAQQQIHGHPIGPRVEDSLELVDQALAASRDLTRELRPPVLYEDGLVPALRWLASDMAKRHPLQVTVAADTDGTPLDEDLRVMLYGSVRELLLNVVKHASRKEAVVTVGEEDGQLRITVTDRGDSFDPEAALHREQGTGLGLFSIRERLATVGGRMQLDVTPEGGAAITLQIPLAVAAQGEAAALPSHRRSAGPASPPEAGDSAPSVLIVDDHAVVRQGLVTLLAGDPQVRVVGEAGDGVEALAKVEQLRPDLVLMDVNMPRMNGIDATRQIRQRWPHVHVVGLSVQDDPATTQSMLDAGAEAFVSKTADTETLRAAILRPRPAK